MSEQSHTRPGRKRKKRLKASDIQGAKYVASIVDLLRPLRDHCADPKRRLHYDEFCAWLLLYFFTPVVDSLRGLQQASDIPTVRRKLQLPRFSLGSFSEAARTFDPELLAPIVEELGAQIADAHDTPLPPSPLRPTAVDGTLIRALPSMVWALWRDDERRAAKLHLHFDLLKGVPEKPRLSDAQASEIDTMRAGLEAGRLYITDRGYFDFSLMADILRAKSSFVARVRNNIVYDTLEERPIAENARRQGIEADLVVRPGCRDNAIDRPLRLVRIHVTDPPRRTSRVDPKSKHYRTRSGEHTITLVTDQSDLSAEHIALYYRHRWQIELFFRWFKKVLHADRLLSLDEGGLTIIMYCALIASMLITLWTGRKPTKRTFEMLCFVFMGWAEDDDLARHIERLEKTH
jgi:hypothetical protein